LSSHPNPVRLILPTRAIKAADVSVNASPPSGPFGIVVPKPGDSEGARSRTSTVRGVRVFARVKRWWSGFNTFEGIEWLMDGVKLVGGSYLWGWSLGAREEVQR
jgi:hypothetical protein